MSEQSPLERAQALTIHDLRMRLEEATEILAALRRGEVDALVVKPGEAPQIWSVNGVDHIYRVLFETLNEGAMTLNSEGIVLYSNTQFSDLVGRPLQEVLGSPFSTFVAPDCVEQFRSLFLEGLKWRSKGEIRLIRPDASMIPAQVSFQALEIEPIGPTCTAVVSDLSELKKAQQALAEANQDLESRVEARTAELRQEVKQRELLTEQLKDANRRKNEFLAMLGHELRNPLAPITNAVEMIRLRVEHPQDVERARRVVERQIRHMARLVDDLLDVSRITRGLIEVRRERIDLVPVVAAAVASCRPLFEAARHRLTVSLPEGPCCLQGDATRLEQVVVNLLSNAAKYSPSPGHVSVTLTCEDGWSQLSVKDQGRGIPAEMLPNIFDLFAQADTTIDRSLGGLGIGLTVVQSLVVLHGGSVTAHSDGPGQGSELVVRLPLLTPQSETARAPAAAAAADAAPLRVLVVEDNVDSAETLGELLNIWGHETRTAHHGKAAVSLAREFRPHVMMLDIGLPGMDGYAVAEEIRRDQSLGATLIVALTGYGRDDDRRKSEAAGVDIHLTKPVNPDQLRKVLSVVDVGNRGARSALRG